MRQFSAKQNQPAKASLAPPASSSGVVPERTRTPEPDPSQTAAPRSAFDFGRMAVHAPAPGRMPRSPASARPDMAAREPDRAPEPTDEDHKQLSAIQMKSLAISRPDDPDENEADDVARRVADGHSAEIRGTGTAINRKARSSADASPELAAKLASSKGGGRPLDESTRSDMESKMRADFGAVRIHTGNEAHEMNGRLNAKAFTHGQDVYFSDGNYNPNSRSGRELLAHELVHTRQQGSGPGGPLRRQAKGTTEKSAANNGGAIEIQLWETKFGDNFLKYISNKGFEKLRQSRYFSVGAEHKWTIKFAEGVTQTTAEEFRVGLTESKFRLDRHLFEVALQAFKAQRSYSIGIPDSPLQVEVSFTGPSVKYEGSESAAETSLFKIAIEGSFAIGSDNVAAFGFVEENIKKALANYTFSIKASFEISISGHLKQLNQYLKEQKHVEKQKQYKEKAKELKNEKNKSRRKVDDLDAEVKKKQRELRRLEQDGKLSGEQAKQKVESLSKDIEDKKRDLEKARDTWQQNKTAAEEAQAAANQEKRAAKAAAQERRRLENQIRRSEEKAGRLKKLTRKLEQKIEKQLQTLDRLGRRFAERSAKWVEEKAVRLIGRKLAVKLGELVARVILRAIPIIGEILMIWDALTLLWDIGSVLWDVLSDWWSGKERTSGEGGDGSGEGTEGGQHIEDDHAGLAPDDKPGNGGNLPVQQEQRDRGPGTGRPASGQGVGSEPEPLGGDTTKIGTGLGTAKTGSVDQPKAAEDVKDTNVTVAAIPSKVVPEKKEAVHEMENDPNKKVDLTNAKDRDFTCSLYLENPHEKIEFDRIYNAKITVNIALPTGPYIGTANVPVQITRHEKGRVYFTIPGGAKLSSKDNPDRVFLISPDFTYSAEYKGSH